MRARVGIALLLAALVGGGALIAFRDRDGSQRSPPSPSPKPPAVGLPEVHPTLEPERSPAEAAPRDDPGPPLVPVASNDSKPEKPPEVEIRDGAGMELHTGPGNDDVAASVEAPPPNPPVEPPPEDTPSEELPPPPLPPAEPETPEEKDTELVPGNQAAPLVGPVEDPADLPTQKETEGAPLPAPGEAPPAPAGFMAALNNFLRIVTLDGRVQVKLTGRLYLDGALMNAAPELEDQVGDFNNGWEFRAARLGVLGVVDWFEFKIDYDLAGGQTLIGEPDLKDLWVGVRDVPVLGRVRVGRMKEPIGLEQWMSGNARTFMEASLPVALTIGRNPGILAFDTEFKGRLCWWVGLYGHTPANNDFGSPGANFSFRVCGTPIYADEGKRLLHLGLSGSVRRTRADEVTIAQRPESHLAPNIVATPTFTSNRQLVTGLEAVWLDGPLSLQGELLRYSADTEEYGRATFWGGYVYGSYILTGEHRVYRNGALTRPRVSKSVFDGGIGDFEIAVRLSLLSLSSGEFDGGTVNDLTIGLNWYMDDHSRFMLNYIHTHRWGSGSANILQCRLQLDF